MQNQHLLPLAERPPFAWINTWSEQFLRSDYLLPNETPIDRLQRISQYAEQILGIEGFAEKFMRYLSYGWYSLSTPVWTNFGRNRGLPISCYGSFMEDDSASILYTNAEVGMMTKMGGGTSVYFGRLRPRGAPIRDNGYSNGSYSFARLFDRMIEVFSQGSTRRGQCAGYIDIDHPDIEEWLTIQRENSDIQRLFWGVCVGDDWIRAMQAGDMRKREIWAKVLQSRAEVGIPYIFFKDTVNRNAPDIYRSLGYVIHGSNLCVVGDSLAVTSKGIYRVRELAQSGEELILFDGEKAVPATSMRLIEKDADVYTVRTKTGRRHTVTADHKLKTPDGMREVSALKVGDKIAIAYRRGLFGANHQPEIALLYAIAQRRCYRGEEDLFVKHFVWETGYHLDAHHVPSFVWQGDEQTQATYLAAWFTPHSFDEETLLDLSNGLRTPYLLTEEFAIELQILAANLGVYTQIQVLETAFRDSLKAYSYYYLTIRDRASLDTLVRLVSYLKPFIEEVEAIDMTDEEKAWDEVISIEYAGKQDVYCCTVHTDEHVWVCDGIITSNCSEIALSTTPDESFVCCLSSMNLLYYDEWKDTDAVETMIYFLDSVMEDFIRRSQYIPFMERACRFAQRQRALGLGVLGWHSYLQSKRIPIESWDAYQLNIQIFRTIREKAEWASMELARLKGEPPMLEGTGRRNMTLLAIAPTKSSSFILGQVSLSIEPQMSNYYVKDLAKVKVTYRNPFLEQVLESYGRNDTKTWESIAYHNGSVQHLDFLTDEERDTFKTFSEISQMTLVQQAAQRQVYIDQSQSLNLMVHPETPPRDVNQLILTAWELGVKTLYYQYSMNAAQEFNRELLLGCRVCEA